MRSIPLLGLAALLTFALVGCSGSDQDKALELARQVCAGSSPSSDASPTEPPPNPLEDATDMQNLKDALPDFEEVANQAAQAARLDDTWNGLAQALDQVAALASTTAELGGLYRDRRAGISDSNSATKIAQLEQQRDQQLQDDPWSAYRAECRKTTGP
ncbi:hypothetical protein [Streptomyces sp. NPDC059460]|uniref:hypothetical protein n=1 Tax=Streptomyces sp. NPDC059460 TaxID=3346840 RepID=UPI0036B2010A